MRLYKAEGTSGTKFSGFNVNTLNNFLNNSTIVEAQVVKCDTNLDLIVDLGMGIRGIIPYAELEYHHDGAATKSIAAVTRVGKFTCFKVKSIDTDENGAVTKVNLSRKEAQHECYENYISKLQVGQVIEAKITHVEDYGAFCDIGCGIIALLPIENFCVARLKNPKVDLKHIHEIKVIVKEIHEDGRIILTQKELLGTWEEEAAKFSQSEIVVGTVRIVEKYGVFVELTPNLSGLAEITDGVQPGDKVSVLIKAIIPEKMKVKLLIVEKSVCDMMFTKLDYKIPESGFVNHWVYSPASCDRVIESFIGEVNQ